MDEQLIIPLSQAVEAIKTAILQGQYEANKDVNRIQLAVYFAIGKYLSKNTRRLPYGAGAIKAISDQLLREMPGLRGYSETSMKKMRLFYEAWQLLDADSSIVTDKSQSPIAIVESSRESSVTTDELQSEESSVATDDLQLAINEVDIELKVGEFKPSYLGTLTTYLRILDDKVRKPHENPSIGIVLCKSANKKFVEYVIQDYQKPMGVATYTTAADMPEQLRKALPDMEELRRVLAKEPDVTPESESR